MSIGVSVDPALSRMMRGEEMLQAEEVAAMLRLHELGWGAKRLWCVIQMWVALMP
jgi:uncharacterized membrane-anchored protein